MMKSKTIARAALCVAAAILSGCGLGEAPPFSPERIGQIQREQARETGMPVMEALPVAPPVGGTVPTTLPARTEKRGMGPVVTLTLQEVIARTVANSLDVRVASFQPSIDEARITEARSRFDPVFSQSFQFSKNFQQLGLGGSLEPSEVLAQQIQTGIKQNLPDGGQIELSNQMSRQEVTPASITAVNPFYQSQLVLQLTQPLLRDFGGEVNRARITISQYDQRISQLDWRDKLEQALADTEEAYWRLYQARENMKIQEELLSQTEDTLEILIKRLKQDVSRVQVAQSQASVQSRRAELVRLRAQIVDVSDQLKRIMNDPDLSVASPQTILPADKPIEEAIVYSLEDQIQAALENRFDLMQQKYRIASASTVVKAARNNELPQLNLQGSVGMQAMGDDVDNYLDNYDKSSRSRLVTYSLGLSFEVPFGNRGARAIYLRTLLQQQQAMVQYRALVEQSALEVKKYCREVETAWSEIVATRNWRYAAADTLAAINQRERGGEALTPSFVQLKLDRQEELARAWRSEIQAIVNYNIAVAQLEKAKGTIMRYDNVAMKEESGRPLGFTKGSKR